MSLKIEMTPEVTLTKSEQAALMHRLEMADEIAEVLTEPANTDEPVVPESAEIVADRVRILARIIGGEARTIPPIAGELDKAILVEAVEGSTYAASLEDEPQKRAACIRVLRALAGKMITAGIASEIDVPVH